MPCPSRPFLTQSGTGSDEVFPPAYRRHGDLFSFRGIRIGYGMFNETDSMAQIFYEAGAIEREGLIGSLDDEPDNFKGDSHNFAVPIKTDRPVVQHMPPYVTAGITLIIFCLK